MQTVYDLIRAEAALMVRCRNCDHQGKVSPVLLRDRIGLYGRFQDARWRCSLCDGRNVEISIGAESVAIPPKYNYRRLI